MLVDEICLTAMLSKLTDQKIPLSIRLILVLNPTTSSQSPLTLPPSFLRVNLTTPYRSTIAITSFARFIAKYYQIVPEGDFGSDVEGVKPTLFDVGKDARKMKEALAHCRKHLGDKATILYDMNIPSSIERMVKEQGKPEGGPWDCHYAGDYFGWEADRLVAVTNGHLGMELITRARTHLSLILVEWFSYEKIKKYFQKAADLGLVEIVQLNAGAVELSKES